MAIGVGAIAAPGLFLKMFGFGHAQRTTAAQVTAQLFGVREIALGAITTGQVMRNPCQPLLSAVNAGVDGGDALVMVATVARRDKRGERPAAGGILLAVPVTATWLWLHRQSRAMTAAEA